MGTEKFVRSKDVRVGDTIFKGSNGSIILVLVSKVEMKAGRGALAPATFDGTALFNDVVTSNYAIFDHDVSHAVMAPLRWAYQVSPSLVNNWDGGIHPYAKSFAKYFSNWVAHPPALIAAARLDSN